MYSSSYIHVFTHHVTHLWLSFTLFHLINVVLFKNMPAVFKCSYMSRDILVVEFCYILDAFQILHEWQCFSEFVIHGIFPAMKFTTKLRWRYKKSAKFALFCSKGVKTTLCLSVWVYLATVMTLLTINISLWHNKSLYQTRTDL